MKKLKTKLLTKKIIKYFLMTFVPLVFTMMIITSFVEKSNRNKVMFAIKSRENSGLAYHSKLVSNQFEMISTDLMVLSEVGYLLEYIKMSSAHNLDNAKEFFLSFSKRKKIYDQVRFLDIKGQEKIRINFNDGKPSVVKASELQFKGDRYYFQNTLNLDRGFVFISPFDLNIENGKIEEPLKPVIRFGVPVFDSNNMKRGVIVINYLGNKLLEGLHTPNSASVFEPMLLNKEGYWLHDINEENEWGFMYKDKAHKKIQSKLSTEWNEISKNDNGQFENQRGLFTYSTIYPLKEIDDLLDRKDESIELANKYYWKLVSFYPETKLEDEVSVNTINIRTIQFIISLMFFIGSIVLARVIVLRKEAEEKKEETLKELISKEKIIEKHNKFLNSVLDSISSPFCVIDVSDYTIKMANSAYNSKGLQIGHSTCHSISHKIDVPCHENGEDCPIKSLIETKKGTVVEHIHYDDEGDANVYEIHGYPIFDDNGNVTEMIEYTFDITKRREAEVALKKSEVLLKKLNADKDKFFSIISHDLRSPFQGIKGIMNLLKNEFENLEEDEVEEAIYLLDDSINSLYDLLEGLLEWSRVQSGKMKFNPEKINLSEVCNNITQLLKTNAINKNITIINEVDNMVEVFADKNMISGVIRNLVSNAIKFSRGGGEIKYSVKSEGDKQRITVSDTGIGMREEDRAKLFRIDVHHTTAGTQDEAGTGVGLILCKSLVEKNGGKIRVVSELGVGSKFIFSLPSCKEFENDI